MPEVRRAENVIRMTDRGIMRVKKKNLAIFTISGGCPVQVIAVRRASPQADVAAGAEDAHDEGPAPRPDGWRGLLQRVGAPRVGAEDAAVTKKAKDA